MNSINLTLFPSLTPKQMSALDRYTSLLLEWNTHIRLTGYHSQEQVREHLLLEPILAFHYLQGRLPNSLPRIDFGSGNGSPGLVMALLDPDHSYLLVERVQKKRIFLENVSRHLSLSNVTVVPSIDSSVFSPLVFMKAITVNDFLSDKNVKRHFSPPCLLHPLWKRSSFCLPTPPLLCHKWWDSRVGKTHRLFPFSP